MSLNSKITLRDIPIFIKEERKMKKFFIYGICLPLLVSLGCAPAISQKQSPEPGGTRLFVVRHAEAYKNLPLHSIWSKEKQDSLTPEGLKQAEKAGRYLKERNMAVVVASPTGRTRQTARIIAQEIGLKGGLSEDPAFKSMKMGKTPKGKPVTWSWRKEQWKAGHDPRPQGGESLQEAVNRAVQAAKTLIRQYPERGVVIVTHSDICAGLAGHAANTPFYQRYEKHGVGLGSVTEIVVNRKGDWTLVP
jgi:broad specificity phosphatase PhoE